VWREIVLGVALVGALGSTGAAQASPSASAEVPGDRARGPAADPLTLRRDTSQGLSPGYTFVGLGITAALGGVMVWSLVDTLAASDRYHADPTAMGYQEGRRRVRRTWFLGVGAGVAASATLLIAVLGTRWGDPAEGPQLSLGPRGALVGWAGRFP